MSYDNFTRKIRAISQFIKGKGVRRSLYDSILWKKMHVTLVFWHPNCVFMAALEFRFSVAVSTFKTDIIGAKSFLKSYLNLFTCALLSFFDLSLLSGLRS